MKKIAVIISAALILVIFLISCEDSVTTPTSADTYWVEAVLVKNLASTNGASNINLVLRKNGTYYQNADISLANISLDTSRFEYSRTFTPSQIYPDSSYILNIKDSTFLDIDLTITLPGEFTAEITDLPVSRIYSGGSVSVGWTISTGTDGYLLATIPPDTIPADSGYEAYASGTSGSIPTDALNFNQVAIKGKHVVYMASYTGAPTKFEIVPFGIPVANNPPDSVFSTNLSGRVAGIVIAVPDSVIVPTQ